MSDSVAIMVNGRINRIMDAGELARRPRPAAAPARRRPARRGGRAEAGRADAGRRGRRGPRSYRVSRRGADADGRGRSGLSRRPLAATAGDCARARRRARRSRRRRRTPEPARSSRFRSPSAIGRTALVVGTFDTKGAGTALHPRPAAGARTFRCAPSISRLRASPRAPTSRRCRSPRCIPRGSARGLFRRSRRVGRGDGGGLRALDRTRARHRRRDLGGRLRRHLAGDRGHARACRSASRRSWSRPSPPARSARYVGAADIMMMHSVADVQGLNSITEQVLGNAAHALAGMISATAHRRGARGAPPPRAPRGRDHHVRRDDARGAGDRRAPRRRFRLPRVPRDGHRRPLDGEARRFRPARRLHRPHDDRGRRHARRRRVCPPTPIASARRSARACPMSARSARSTWSISGRATTVPERFRNRRLVVHNPNVTLMRTTRDENRAIGEWIGARLNRMEGPVRLLLPEGGVSAARRARASRSTIPRPTPRCSRRSRRRSGRPRRRRIERITAQHQRRRHSSRRRSTPSCADRPAARTESLMARIEREAIVGEAAAR